MIELSYPGDLTDAGGLAQQLSATGLGFEACESKSRLFAKCMSALAVTGPASRGQAPLAFFVPGRIEVLGKHTDYAGGRTMVTATEQGLCVVALPREDRQLTIINSRSGDTVRFRVDAELTPSLDTWSKYPMTIARRVARDFPGAYRGADIALCGDLPPGAGLGGAASLMVGVFLVLAEVNQLSARDEYWHDVGSKTDLARYLGAVKKGLGFGRFAGDGERGHFGDSEDQAAILCAESGHISQYAYCPLELEKLLPMPIGCVFAVGATGLAVGQTEAQREMCLRVSRLLTALEEIWRRETGRDDPHLAAALGSAPDAAEQLRKWLKTVDTGPFDRAALAARLEQFVIESGEVIPEASAALAVGDIGTFGHLVDRSQQAAERFLGNQLAETRFLASSARRHGAVAATSFGVGLGGSVWALLEAAAADDVLTSWADEYRDAFPEHARQARFFLTAAGPAAFRVC